MPLLAKSLQSDYLNAKEEKDFIVSDDDDNDYNFKYVPANVFDNIVKNVHRQRCKADEELVWANFVSQQELNNLNYDAQDYVSSMERTAGTSRHSMNKINRQAKVLEKDALSDRSKRMCTSSTAIDNLQNLSQTNRSKNTLLTKKLAVKNSSANGSGATSRIQRKANISSPNKSLDNKSYKTHVKHSASDNVMPKKKTVHSRHLPFTMNTCDYDSNTELSLNNDNCKEETIFMRVDPAVAQKIIAKQKNISCLLDELLFRLHKIPLPDGEEDVKRRQQREMEFGIRFSRNYLYELHKDVTTVQRHIHAILFSARIKASQGSIAFHMHTVEQKLISAHQLLLRALVAYCKHIPCSIIREEPNKLKELLQVILDLKDICNKVHLEADYFGSGDDGRSLETDIYNKCSVILSKLSLRSNKDSQAICHDTHTLCSSVPMVHHRKKFSANKNLCNRLHMYNTDSKTNKTHYKKKLSTCSSKNSKYGISGNTLSVNSPSTPDRTNPTPVTQVSPKEITHNKSTKRFTSLREDDINTMMDFVPVNVDNNSRTEQYKRQNTIVISNKFKTLSKFSNKSKDSQCSKPNSEIVNDKRRAKTNYNEDYTKKLNLFTQKHLSNLISVIADLMCLAPHKKSEEANENLDASVTPNVDYAECHTLQNPSAERVYERVPPKTKSSENVKLVYMSSMESTLDTPQRHDASCQADYESLTGFFNHGKTDYKKKDVQRVSSPSKPVRIAVSEAVNFQFLTWRNEYQRFSQENPMYSANVENKPWKIVTWISDKLVDELIAEIAKELELNDLIQKLFKLEFEEY